MPKERKPKRTKVEALLDKVRKNPSPTCRDRRQIDLSDYLKVRAFSDLDRVIEKTLGE